MERGACDRQQCRQSPASAVGVTHTEVCRIREGMERGVIYRAESSSSSDDGLAAAVGDVNGQKKAMEVCSFLLAPSISLWDIGGNGAGEHLQRTFFFQINR